MNILDSFDCDVIPMSFRGEDGEVNVAVRQDEELKVLFGQFEIVHDTVETEIPVYKGKYTVKPTIRNEQVLETKDKKMVDDVTVKEIPYYDLKLDGNRVIYIATDYDG